MMYEAVGCGCLNKKQCCCKKYGPIYANKFK